MAVYPEAAQRERGRGVRLARTGLRTGLLACGLVFAAAAPAVARCERTDYTANPPANTRSAVQMTASTGKECVLRLSAARRVTVTDRRIVVAPTHGKATIEGETVFYRSFPGYQGPDSFTAEIAGKNADGQGVAAVAVQVSVTD